MVQLECLKVIHPLLSFTCGVQCRKPFYLNAGKEKCCMCSVNKLKIYLTKIGFTDSQCSGLTWIQNVVQSSGSGVGQASQDFRFCSPQTETFCFRKVPCLVTDSRAGLLTFKGSIRGFSCLPVDNDGKTLDISQFRGFWTLRPSVFVSVCPAVTVRPPVCPSTSQYRQGWGSYFWKLT